MDARQAVDELGGRRAVQDLTGLTRGRIHQWVTWNRIPRPWVLFLKEKRPDLDWESLLEEADQKVV